MQKILGVAKIGAYLTIFSKNDMTNLERIAEKYDLIILSDEVYEHLVFDNKKHLSICSFPKLFNRSIATFSFGKTFHVTGWKLGYVVAPKQLMSEIRKVHQFNVFSANHPLQLAVADYLENEEHFLRLNEFYEQKRDLFLEIIGLKLSITFSSVFVVILSLKLSVYLQLQ